MILLLSTHHYLFERLCHFYFLLTINLYSSLKMLNDFLQMSWLFDLNEISIMILQRMLSHFCKLRLHYSLKKTLQIVLIFLYEKSLTFILLRMHFDAHLD